MAVGLAASLGGCVIVTAAGPAAMLGADGPSPDPSGSASPAASRPPACAVALQDLVDAAPPASTLRLPACTSTETLYVRQPLVIDAHGTLIDGQRVLEHGVIVEADDVVLDGLTVTRAANPPQDGAVQAWDVRRFVFRDGVITDSAGACISVARSPDAQIVDSTLEGCAQSGIHGTKADGLVVRGNVIRGNNPQDAFDPEWEAGGAKVTDSKGVLFEANDVSGNGGPGLWCDIDCQDLEVRDNRVWANDRVGIQVEISRDALVKGNTVWENGWAKTGWGWGAGILVSSSSGVTVDSNVLAWNADGIVVVSQDREDAPSPIIANRTSAKLRGLGDRERRIRAGLASRLVG